MKKKKTLTVSGETEDRETKKDEVSPFQSSLWMREQTGPKTSQRESTFTSHLVQDMLCQLSQVEQAGTKYYFHYCWLKMIKKKPPQTTVVDSGCLRAPGKKNK